MGFCYTHTYYVSMVVVMQWFLTYFHSVLAELTLKFVSCGNKAILAMQREHTDN